MRPTITQGVQRIVHAAALAMLWCASVQASSLDSILGTGLTFGTGSSSPTTERVRILQTGNVGISNTAPKAKLDVVGTISASDAIQISGSSLTCAANITGGAIRYTSGTGIQYCGGNNTWTSLSSDTTGGGGTVTGTGTGTYVPFWTGASSLGADSKYTYTTGTGTVSVTAISATNISGTTVQIGGGSLAVPSLGFAADGNTGFYRPAADNIAVTTNGAETLRIASTGRVGIGTQTPTSVLQVSGTFTVSTSTQTTTPSLYVNSSGNVGFGTTAPALKLDVQGDIGVRAGNTLRLFRTDNGNYATLDFTNNYFRINTGGIFVMDTLGNVGISTTAPIAKLDVAGNISTSGVIQVSGSSLTCAANSLGGAIRYTSGTGIQYCGGNNTWTSLSSDTTGGGGTVTGSGTNTYVPFWTSANSLGADAKYTYTTGTGTVSVTAVSATNISGTTVQIGGGSLAVPSLGFAADGNTGFYRPAADNIAVTTNGAETLRIASTGRVGIGITNPGAILDVSSTMKFSGTVSNTLSWGTIGVAAPAAASAGMKLQLYGSTPNTMALGDYALGVEGSHLWANTGGGYKWYEGGLLKMQMDTLGNLGIGAAPAGTTTFYVISDTTDVASNYGVYTTLTQRTTTNGARSTVGIQSSVNPIVSTGVSNTTGNTQGLNISNLRNNASDVGGLNGLYGAVISYGHNTGTATARQTSSTFGIYLQPYAQNGTMKDVYDLYLSTAPTGATVTGNRWGIYQVDATIDNYLGGTLGVGRTNPVAKLDVVGTVSTTDAIQVGASALTCSAAIAGAVRYNSTSNTLQICVSSIWTSLSSGTVAGTGATGSGTNTYVTYWNGPNTITADAKYTYTVATGTVSVTAVSATNISGTTVQIGPGSVAVPSLGFAADGNTGLYRPLADVIALSHNGTEATRFASTGISTTGTLTGTKVGVNLGITAPAVQVEVSTSGEGLRLSTVGPATAHIPYMTWYNNAVRQAYMGYGNTGATVDFNLALENGNKLNIITSNTTFSGHVFLNNPTSRTIAFGTAGLAAPAANSVGMRLQLYGASPNVMAAGDYALGIEGSNMWFNSGGGFKFYANTFLKALIDASGNVSATTFRADDNTDSVTAPGHSWGGDTNTGFYRAAADTIGVTVGGAEKARFDSNGGFGVGTAAANNNSAAILQADSTSRGFLPPRMTTTQRNAISNPPAGLLIYNTTTNGIEYYDGSTWYKLSAGTTLTGGTPTYLAAGMDSQGQYGDNNATSGGAGTAIQQLSGTGINGKTFTNLSLGAYTEGQTQSWSCGIEASTNLGYCWGANGTGQLGDSTTVNKAVPTAVTGGFTWTTLTAGSHLHTCGIRSNNAGYCWGYNANGQVGDGSTTQRTSPTLVAGGFTWSSLIPGGAYDGSAHRGFTCGIVTGGTGYCWGNNGWGQLGTGNTTARSSPSTLSMVTGGYTWSKLAPGTYHTCGVTTGNTLYCWGNNSYSELGNGNTTNSSTPVQIGATYSWSDVISGAHWSCGLTTMGKAYCWGINTYGSIGDGSTTNRSTPTPVFGGKTWRKLTGGYYTVCGISTQNALYCWGFNAQGQLGTGDTGNFSKPQLVLDTVTDAEQSGYHLTARVD